MTGTAQISLETGRKFPYDQGERRRPPKAKDWAEAAARGVLADLCDRRGIKWALQDDEITDDVRREIVASLAAIIRLAHEQASA
jgi:hypothetical protein